MAQILLLFCRAGRAKSARVFFGKALAGSKSANLVCQTRTGAPYIAGRGVLPQRTPPGGYPHQQEAFAELITQSNYKKLCGLLLLVVGLDMVTGLTDVLRQRQEHRATRVERAVGVASPAHSSSC